MKVYVAIETCCNHFGGVFADKEEADIFAKDNDYSVYEYDLSYPATTLEMAYVSEYGNWGTEKVLVFEKNLLTEEQYDNVSVLPDYDKMSYVQAIIDGNDLAEWEE